MIKIWQINDQCDQWRWGIEKRLVRCYVGKHYAVCTWIVWQSPRNYHHMHPRVRFISSSPLLTFTINSFGFCEFHFPGKSFPIASFLRWKLWLWLGLHMRQRLPVNKLALCQFLLPSLSIYYIQWSDLRTAFWIRLCLVKKSCNIFYIWMMKNFKC